MTRLLAFIGFFPVAVLAAPTVSLTAPTTGNLYLAPATFAVKANASASGVGINRVEFYANGVLIQTDTTNPYQFDWSAVAAGSYSITAVAYDNNGASTVSSPKNVVVSGSNIPPTVSLSTPADNSRYLNPSSISISAAASGPELNDIVASVAFYLNGSLAQTVTSAPFSYSATGLAVGTYTLTAVATDSQGAQTTSAQRTFTVSSTNVPPTVSLVIPQDNTRWNAPATVTFQASVNSGEANDTVSVEFFANGVSQGVRSSFPFSLTQSLSAGTYTITAVATDGQSAQTTSAARTITVSNTNNPPTASITSPAPNANFPTAPAGFTLSAAANSGEINGWITKVDFYVNGTLVNTDTAAPYSYAVSGLANGTYTLTAVATDQLNAQTTSAPVVVSVGAAPLTGYFIHTDHLNTPRAIYDASQQVRWKWDQQEPFGVNAPDANPGGAGAFEFPGRFRGQYADKETGTTYNYSRNYNPDIGRYLESDPVGLKGGLNTFSYVSGLPLLLTDFLGLAQQCEHRFKWGREFEKNWESSEGVVDLGGVGTPDSKDVAECAAKKKITPSGKAKDVADMATCMVNSMHNSGIHLYKFIWDVHHEIRQELFTELWCKEGCPPDWKFKRRVAIDYILVDSNVEQKSRLGFGRPGLDSDFWSEAGIPKP